MRQQLADGRHLVCRQALQHVFHLGVRVVTIEPGRVHQRHHGSGPLAGAQTTGEEPVVFSNRNRADLPFEVIVVDRQASVIEEPRELHHHRKLRKDYPGPWYQRCTTVPRRFVWKPS